MRKLLVTVFLMMSAQAFAAVENLEQFNEQFMERTCKLAGATAAQRAKDIVKGGDTYDGEIGAYKGQKIVRLIQVARSCEAVMTDVGMQYRYWLTIQVQAN